MGHKHDDETEPHNHVEEEWEEMDEEEDDIVVLADVDGNEKEFAFLAVVQVDDQDFALLTPADAPDDPDAETEIFIFRYEQDEDGGEIFSEVEDETLFAKVQAEAEKVLMGEADD